MGAFFADICVLIAAALSGMDLALLGLVKRVKAAAALLKRTTWKFCPSLDFAIAARYTRFVMVSLSGSWSGCKLPDMPLQWGCFTSLQLFQLRSLVISQPNTKGMLRQQGCKSWPNALKTWWKGLSLRAMAETYAIWPSRCVLPIDPTRRLRATFDGSVFGGEKHKTHAKGEKNDMDEQTQLKDSTWPKPTKRA